MRPDALGALYPHIDTTSCVDCGICARTCPFASPVSPLPPRKCYAAVNKNDEERRCSSSGGVFIELARQTISRGGVVFGAVFADDWSVVHTFTDTLEGVLPMMGSKYVQSDTSNTYGHARLFLEQGREVLYTGTPCQIAGLKHFLRKDYPKLLAVEVICHGAPVPAVWKSYLEEILARPKGVRAGENTVFPFLNAKPDLSGISFRNKKLGWRKYGFSLRVSDSVGGGNNSVSSSVAGQEVFYEPLTENSYMAAFLNNWSLRLSCYDCKAKNGASQADLTIGDFWGAGCPPAVGHDDKGVSCVVCRTEKGHNAIQKSEHFTLLPVSYDEILLGNPSLEQSVKLTYAAKRFQQSFIRNGFYGAMRRVEPLLCIAKIQRIVPRAIGFLKRRVKF